MAQQGAVWHSRVRRGTAGAAWHRGCGVAQRVRRGTVGCGVAQLGCGVAQQGAAWHNRVRRGTVSSASACCMAGPSSISARHPTGGPLPSGSYEEIKSGTRRVLYIKYCIVTTRNNIRASIVVALYSMSAIRELYSKSGNTFI